MVAYEQLQEHIATLNDLLNILNILKWDARTQMPPGGSQTRGYQLATVSRLAREHFTSETTARLLDAAEAEIAGEDPDSYRVRAVQQTRQYYEIVRRIPADLLARRATLAPISEQVWHEAKQHNDFARFAPYLQQMLDLAREQADAIGYEEHPFDALVFEYEPSMTAAKLRSLFDALKAGLLPLLEQIVAHDRPLEKNLWAREYPLDRQRAFALEMVNMAYRHRDGIRVRQAPRLLWPTPTLPLGLAAVRGMLSRGFGKRTVDAETCTRCGVCVEACPVGAVSLDAEGGLPAFSGDCIGCWACFNNCPERAILSSACRPEHYYGGIRKKRRTNPLHYRTRVPGDPS